MPEIRNFGGRRQDEPVGLPQIPSECIGWRGGHALTNLVSSGNFERFPQTPRNLLIQHAFRRLPPGRSRRWAGLSRNREWYLMAIEQPVPTLPSPPLAPVRTESPTSRSAEPPIVELSGFEDDEDLDGEDADNLDEDEAADGDELPTDAEEDDLDSFDDIDDDDFDDEFDDDFEEELEDDYELDLDDDIPTEFGGAFSDDDNDGLDDDDLLDDVDDLDDLNG